MGLPLAALLHGAVNSMSAITQGRAAGQRLAQQDADQRRTIDDERAEREQRRRLGDVQIDSATESLKAMRLKNDPQYRAAQRARLIAAGVPEAKADLALERPELIDDFLRPAPHVPESPKDERVQARIRELTAAGIPLDQANHRARLEFGEAPAEDHSAERAAARREAEDQQRSARVLARAEKLMQPTTGIGGMKVPGLPREEAIAQAVKDVAGVDSAYAAMSATGTKAKGGAGAPGAPHAGSGGGATPNAGAGGRPRTPGQIAADIYAQVRSGAATAAAARAAVAASPTVAAELEKLLHAQP